MGSLPLLSKPTSGEVLYIYLVISPSAINAVLIHEKGQAQNPICYVSHSMVLAKTHYPDMVSP